MSATAQHHDYGAQRHDHGPPPSDEGRRTGDPAIDALTRAHTLGREKAESGDLTGARTLLEDALTAGELQLGRDHPNLAPLMVDLATIARNVGNLTEAQNQLRRAYAVVIAAIGPEHSTALSIEGRLAAVCYRLGESTEAYDWHIVEAGPHILGPDHPAVRGAQQRLAAAKAAEAAPVTPPQLPIDEPAYGYGGWAPPEEDLPLDSHGYTSTEPGIYHRRNGPRAADAAEREYTPVATYADQSSTDRMGRRKGHAGGVMVVASLGIIILVAAGIAAVQLFSVSNTGGSSQVGAPQPTSASTAMPSAPAANTDAPGRVAIADRGGSVTLSWSDPSNGLVPFIVTGGRDGTVPEPMGTVPAGKTTLTIYGLNDRFDYCYTVAAVWSTDRVEPSARTCTHRLSTTGTPSVPITASTA